MAVILWLVLNGYCKQFSVLLSVALCGILLFAASSQLAEILDFLRDLRDSSGLNGELLRILIRAVGIGLLAELVSMICTDAGNAALGKAFTTLSSIVIVWNSLPVFTALLELISDILGEL